MNSVSRGNVPISSIFHPLAMIVKPVYFAYRLYQVYGDSMSFFGSVVWGFRMLGLCSMSFKLFCTLRIR